MHFREIPIEDRLEYRDLLLLADEQMDMVERYLFRGTMFMLFDAGDPEARGSILVTNEGAGVFEIKNLAVRQDVQRQGYGIALVRHVIEHVRAQARTLLVGTGESPATLGFYQHCGFVRSHVIKNFFTDNYDHPIIEEGRQLVDMICLAMDLASSLSGADRSRQNRAG